MTAIGNEQASFHRYRHCSFDRIRFLYQRERVQNDAAANDAFDARLKDSGRDEMENVPAVPDVDRVTGIVAALIARYTVEALGKDIDDLTLSFVSPLSTNDCKILGHLNVYPQGSSISSRSSGTKG